MRTDLVLNLFGEHADRMLDVARVADEAGFGALWVNDHFSGAVVDAPWSRDPFVALGALAAVTERVDLGLLVANIVNRHAAQLASAVNTVQSIAPGRVRVGVGSGAAPGSRFAVEHEMIGRHLADPAGRRAHLVEYVATLRSIWSDGARPLGDLVRSVQHVGVTDGAHIPHLIVGASAWPTIEVAIAAADGVNIRRTGALGDQLARLAAARLPDGFEVSVLDSSLDLQHPTGGDVSDLRGVARRIVTVTGDVDLDALRAFGSRLASA